jgi:hypothetical protein
MDRVALGTLHRKTGYGDCLAPPSGRVADVYVPILKLALDKDVVAVPLAVATASMSMVTSTSRFHALM